MHLSLSFCLTLMIIMCLPTSCQTSNIFHFPAELDAKLLESSWVLVLATFPLIRINFTQMHIHVLFITFSIMMSKYRNQKPLITIQTCVEVVSDCDQMGVRLKICPFSYLHVKRGRKTRNICRGLHYVVFVLLL